MFWTKITPSSPACLLVHYKRKSCIPFEHMNNVTSNPIDSWTKIASVYNWVDDRHRFPTQNRLKRSCFAAGSPIMSHLITISTFSHFQFFVYSLTFCFILNVYLKNFKLKIKQKWIGHKQTKSLDFTTL